MTLDESRARFENKSIQHRTRVTSMRAAILYYLMHAHLTRDIFDCIKFTIAGQCQLESLLLANYYQLEGGKLNLDNFAQSGGSRMGEHIVDG